ncbi:MAG: hypothetical protein NW205_12975 [Hyphomicrobiaceae bacterium]|nr:hypothetical protein [Hyphomicrobiaceae bacterium]
MEIPDIGFDALGSGWLAIVIALPLSFLVSWLLLALYVRSVVGAMARASGTMPRASGTTPNAPASPTANDVAPLRPLDVITMDAAALAGDSRAVRRMWAGALVHVAAGLVFAAVLSVAFMSAMGLRFDLRAALLGAVMYSWPVAIVTAMLAATTWQGVARVIVMLGLATAGVLGAVTAGTPVSAGAMAALWWSTNAEPTLLVMACLARPVRAAGPLVALLTFAAVLGAIYGIFAIYNSDVALSALSRLYDTLGLPLWAVLAVALLAGAIPFAIAAWGLLRRIGAAYRARAISDQSINVDAVILIFAISYGLGLSAQGALWLAVPLIAVAVYRAVLIAGYRLIAARLDRRQKPPDLLLLRVFSLGGRSEALFDAVAKPWRSLGTLSLIAGPDLARATVAPHEFLEFLSGRLARRFISSPAEFDARLAESAGPAGLAVDASARDPDLRYRATSFYCHDDTWRGVLAGLARRSDVVLMDLRGFTAAARGCAYEIDELFDLVALARIVFIIDSSTKRSALDAEIARAWSGLDPASPNRTDAAPELILVRLETLDEASVHHLVGALARRSAGPGPEVATRARLFSRQGDT